MSEAVKKAQKAVVFARNWNQCFLQKMEADCPRPASYHLHSQPPSAEVSDWSRRYWALFVVRGGSSLAKAVRKAEGRLIQAVKAEWPEYAQHVLRTYDRDPILSATEDPAWILDQFMSLDADTFGGAL